jgi:hypothetical protein
MRREHRYKDFAPRIDVDALLADHNLLLDYHEKENKRGEIEYVGQCPDPWGLHKHGDTTGKFALNVDKKVYNCFVCGGGSLMALTMAVLDLDADAAIDVLLSYADDTKKTDTQWMDDIDRILGQLGQDPFEEEVLPYFNVHLLDKWESYAENLRLWNAGEFDGKPKDIDWDILLLNARFAPDAVKYAPRDREGKPLDDPYYGPAVLFPHWVGSRLVGWQHRWLSDMRPKWLQKYTNTPDFPKRTTLYTPQAIGMHSHLPVTVVESVPTALYIAGLGWPVVATFGATVTPEQLKLLRRFQQGVILAPDCDKPGVESLVKVADYLEGFIPVSYVEPEGDVGDDLLDRGVRGEPVDLLLRSAIRIS